MRARHLTLAFAAAFAVGASAQVVYTPVRTAADQGITLRGWGSGTIRETDEAALEGSASIRVSSRNIFQGGIMEFATPIDLTTAFGDKNSLLQFAILLPGAATGATSGAGGGGRPGGVSGISGASPGQEQENRPGQGAATAADAPALENVRVVITTSDGKKSETFLNVAGRTSESGWIRAAVPLAAIRGFAASDKKVKSIALSGDAVASFFIGEASIVTDSTPLYAEPNVRELNLGLGEEYTFSAFGSGGSSELVFSWDFDSADGVQADAEGVAVSRRFRKPGKFTVTLTVRDAFGLKQPYSTTLVVEVNP